MDFVISFLSTPAILLGLVAMVGLLAQKKKGSEVKCPPKVRLNI